MKKISKKIIAIIGVSVVATLFVGCKFGKVKKEKLDKTEIDSFNDINLNVDVADIDIIPTSGEFAIEYEITNQTIDYKVADDKLTVNTKSVSKFGINSNEKSLIKIYVPKDKKYASLTLKGDVGSINFDNITFDDADITTDVGSVTLTDITVNNNLNISTDVGNIDVKLTNSECSYKISADVANININGTTYDGMNVKKTYSSEEGPKINIETDCGEINLNY